jgi:glycosyltransferase involved in cell wall biosynthesis
MNVLVWHWGRRGAGPLYAAALAQGLERLSGVDASLSLSSQAEIMHGADPPRCDFPVATYKGRLGAIWRLLMVPFDVGSVAERLRPWKLDLAICAMPAALDLLMAAALRRLGVPYIVVMHDADVHPGDGMPLQMPLQRRLARGADGLVALSTHVADRLRQQGLVGGKHLVMSSLPPLVFGPKPLPPLAHGSAFRLLSFGRLLPYKGLDLLAEALKMLGPRSDLEVRVVGIGPESAALADLRALPGVTVENRWVPEAELAGLMAWADALVLSHRESSQSGVAAAAIAAGRWLVATRVGGMIEQLKDESLAVMCDPDAASLCAALASLLATPPPLGYARDIPTEWRRAAENLLLEFRALRGAPSLPHPAKGGGRAAAHPRKIAD